MGTPEQIAAGLRAAADDLGNDRALMQRIVLVVERTAKQRTPVDTGTLRRSVTSRVLTAQKGVVGTNVSYARYVHEGTRYMRGRPFLRQGLEASRSTIQRYLEQYGDGVIGRVT